MNLCTLNQLKTRLDISDAGSDGLLGGIITGVSGQLQGAGGCGRQLGLQADRVELISVSGSRMASVWVSIYPIVSISEIKEALYGAYDDADALTVNEDYQFVAATGELRRIGSWLAGIETIRITYTAGYAAPGDELGAGETALPDEIVEAAIQQAAFTYQKRDKLGLTALGSQGGSASGYAADKILAGPKITMQGYRRFA